MKYDYFIGMIKHYETDRVKAFRGDNHSTLERIPDAFGLLIPDIINILNKNLHNLCNINEGIVIFGLQPASMMVTSNEPLVLKRYLKDYQPDYHFCCTLEYIVVPIEEIDNVTVWNHTESVIVDFTSGAVMDSERYMSIMLEDDKTGTVYGKINPYTLAIAWTIMRIRQAEPYAKKIVYENNKKVLDPDTSIR